MRRIISFGMIFLLFSIPISLAQSYFEVERQCDQRVEELGREAAIRHWTLPANAGDAKAQFCLGLTIRPLGVWVDTSEQFLEERKEDARIAVEWIRRAAEQGLAPAQEALSLAYARGGDYIDGVAKSPEKARAWMEKAANQGSPSANVFLAQWYRDGDGALPVDKQWAYRHFRLGTKLFEVQMDPSEFLMMMEYFGLQEEVKRLGRELTDEDRVEADSWVESRLQKIKTP
jgi:hypothetical protein